MCGGGGGGGGDWCKSEKVATHKKRMRVEERETES